MKTHLIYSLLLSGVFTVPASAQHNDTLHLSLQQAVEMAREKSISARQASTIRKTKYWEYRTFLSNYKPQLSLEGALPKYIKNYNEVTQPDGSVLFQPVQNNNSALNLSFSQSIAATGGTAFGTTQLQRFDDFERNKVLYNGVPFGIGYTQPLFMYNDLRWEKKIQPLLYAESKQAYIEDMEQIAIKVNTCFFDLLMAQVNLQVAETNLDNTRNIMRIANEKFNLGKISRNEILQLQLEQLKAEKAVGIARRDMEIASLALRSNAGLQDAQKIVLSWPPPNVNMQVNSDKVLAEAYANRSDAIAFERKIAEARRDVAKAKGDNGLNASLTAQLGYSKSGNTIGKVYNAPISQQLVNLTFVIPILDWGRSKSRTKTAEANLEFTTYAVEQDRQIFVQEIVTQVTLYQMMKEQLALTASADSIATEKYQIAKDRYVLGNLSITDLSIAFQEKDQAKRDYITALRDSWGAYYQLRYLSLYDFERNQKIKYL